MESGCTEDDIDDQPEAPVVETPQSRFGSTQKSRERASLFQGALAAKAEAVALETEANESARMNARTKNGPT